MTALTGWARSLPEVDITPRSRRRIPTGSFHLTPVWYLFRNEQLFVGASSSSRKVRNAVARPVASLVVDIRKPGAERWISGSGPVTILRGDESQKINAAIHDRYLTAEALRDPRMGGIRNGRAIFRRHLDRDAGEMVSAS
jgi:Pyridoxamine 5'-phosphate oxidase